MPVLPPPGDSTSSGPDSGTEVRLSDVLSKDRSINVFAGFTRDIDTVEKRLSDEGQNTTILAPVNSAITSLPRKPWESNEEYEKLGTNAYEGAAGEDRAHANLRRFVEEHIVPVRPWAEGKKVKTMGGSEVWWEKKGDKQLIQPGNIEVSSVASSVGNGEIWILKEARNYA